MKDSNPGYIEYTIYGSARADLSTKWSCSITILITFFKNCIFYININYSWLSHHGSPACSTVNNYLPAKSSGIMKLLYVINQKQHLHAGIDNRFSSEALN